MTEDDGGFETVPGFHRFLRTWAKQNPSKDKVNAFDLSGDG